MGLSGFLYVAIVVGWAVYLVPFALKRYDEAARNRSIDRFSSAMRVLGRGEDTAPPEQTGDTSRGAGGLDARPGHPIHQSPGAGRIAAKKAARRRRRVLLLLTLATAGTATAAYLILVPWWSVAIPGTLLLLWLVVCPLQARRERRALRAARVGHDAGQRSRHLRSPHSDAAARPEAATDAGEGRQEDVPASAPAVVAEAVPPTDEEPTVVLDRSSRDDDAVGTGSLWDPVPVTLPTYVHKPRAPRTIRTIDLGAVGVQSSGRASAPAGPDSTHETVDEGTSDEEQATSARAVGE